MPSYGGFGANLAEYARQALPQGMNIGLQAMADAQRRRELADEIARQEQANAFTRMMQQRQLANEEANTAADNQRLQDELALRQKQFATEQQQWEAQEPYRRAQLGLVQAQTDRYQREPIPPRSMSQKELSQVLGDPEFETKYNDDQKNFYRVLAGLEAKAGQDKRLSPDQVVNQARQMANKWMEQQQTLSQTPPDEAQYQQKFMEYVGLIQSASFDPRQLMNQIYGTSTPQEQLFQQKTQTSNDKLDALLDSLTPEELKELLRGQ